MLNSTSGNDIISIDSDSEVMINGDDRIDNSASKTFISLEGGNDSVENSIFKFNDFDGSRQ